MFTAIGVSVKRNRDESLTVRAQIVEDRSGKPIEIKAFTGPTLDAIQALIQTDLAARERQAAAQTLDALVVGQILGGKEPR